MNYRHIIRYKTYNNHIADVYGFCDKYSLRYRELTMHIDYTNTNIKAITPSITPAITNAVGTVITTITTVEVVYVDGYSTLIYLFLN